MTVGHQTHDDRGEQRPAQVEHVVVREEVRVDRGGDDAVSHRRGYRVNPRSNSRYTRTMYEPTAAYMNPEKSGTPAMRSTPSPS